jgi:hypothetical protein
MWVSYFVCMQEKLRSQCSYFGSWARYTCHEYEKHAYVDTYVRTCIHVVSWRVVLNWVLDALFGVPQMCTHATNVKKHAYMHTYACRSFHGGWCWTEYWMPYFAQKGFDTYAVSLRWSLHAHHHIRFVFHMHVGMYSYMRVTCLTHEHCRGTSGSPLQEEAVKAGTSWVHAYIHA